MRKIRRVVKRKRPAPPPRVRPSTGPHGVYLPDSLQLVTMVGMLGATDDEIEKVYGLGTGTLKLWRKHYPKLDDALEHGRTRADVEVLAAMHKTAIGYDYHEDQAVGGKDPQVLRVQRHMPGQFLAQKHWLGQRQRERWPSSDKVQLSGTGKDGAIKVESRNELIDAIIGLVASKPDLEKEKDSKESRAR